MSIQTKTVPIAKYCNACLTAPVAQIVGQNDVFCAQMCKDCLLANEQQVVTYGAINCHCSRHHAIKTVFFRQDFMSMEYIYTAKRIQKRAKRQLER